MNKCRLRCLSDTSRYDGSLVSEGRGWEGGETVHWSSDYNFSRSRLLLHLLLGHVNRLHWGVRGDHLGQGGPLHCQPSEGEVREVVEVREVCRVAGPGVAVAAQLEGEPETQSGLENIQSSSEREDRGRHWAEILERLGLGQCQARHLHHYQGRQQLE